MRPSIRIILAACAVSAFLGSCYAAVLATVVEFPRPFPDQALLGLWLGAALAVPALAWLALRLSIRAALQRAGRPVPPFDPRLGPRLREILVVQAVFVAALTTAFDALVGPLFFGMERASHPYRWLGFDLAGDSGLLAAAGLLGALCVRRPDRSVWRALLGAAAAALAFNLGAGTIAVARRPTPAAARTGPSTAPSGTGIDVILFGIDGASWRILDPMIAEGAMPHLASAIARGARGDLIAEPPFFSPASWTTIATGRSPTEHGIVSYVGTTFPANCRVVPRVDFAARWRFPFYALGSLLKAAGGAEVCPIGAGFRRAAALWDLVSADGGTVNVLNWWTTYPPPRVRGNVVSDAYFDEWLFERFPLTRPLAAPTFYPPTLAPLLERLAPSPEGYDASRLREYGDFNDRDWGRLRASLRDPDAVGEALPHLRWHTAVDENVFRTAIELARESRANLTMAVSGLEDDVVHFFTPYRWPDRFDGVDADEVRRYGHILDVHHRRLDERLGALTDLANDHTVVMLVSDHGYRMLRNNPLSDEAHDEKGIVVAVGGPVRPGDTGVTLSVYDVVPTVLYLLGYPIPPDLRGRPAVDLFDTAFVGRHPPSP